MLTSVEDVIRWLGTDSKGVPYYLHLLNLNWSPEGLDYDLSRYSELTVQLKGSPKVIRALIRESGWRPTLVGNALAILLRGSEFQNDLIWRLVNWTGVAPQVAVGIALVSNTPSIPELGMLLANASSESNPKTVLSAYAALKLCDSEKAEQFRTTALYDTLKAKDQHNCIRIAEYHWDFWKNIKAIKA